MHMYVSKRVQERMHMREKSGTQRCERAFAFGVCAEKVRKHLPEATGASISCMKQDRGLEQRLCGARDVFGKGTRDERCVVHFWRTDDD
jgi:hypothetical protein